MGQGSSQPVRADGDELRQVGRAATVIRRVIPERRAYESEYEQDALLHGGRTHTSWTTRRSPQNSLNRLSQLVRRNDDDLPEVADRSEARPPRGPLLQRTRSRLHGFLRRDGLSNRSSRETTRPPHRGAHHIGDGANLRDDDMPRLPSIDMSSTFDHAFVPSQPPQTARGSDSHGDESSQRRANIRFNGLRSDPLLQPFRAFSSSMRRHRSPQPSITSLSDHANEDQADMLSRLLSVAAATTAATLMGDDPNSMIEAGSLTGGTGLGDLSGGGEDGSFDGFLRALQNGRIASALRQGTTDSGPEDDGSPAPPLNFFRMFRFGPSNSTSGANNAVSAAEGGDQHGRLVPIIIVGIRSISQGSPGSTTAFNEDLPPFIDALGNFSSPIPAQTLGAHGHDSIDAILRPPQNGTSFRHRRRASMGGFGIRRSRYSDRMDDQRDHRSPDRRRDRPWSVASSSNYEPRPPPASPASPSPELSRIPTRNSTPNQSRPTSLIANSVRDPINQEIGRNIPLRTSAASPLSSHTEETASLHSTHSSTNLLGDLEAFRAHRRSDTAPNIHYPRFASGHPRRNGVVEPDNLPSLSRASSQSRTDSFDRHRNGDARSWIIYVLGGSYPENHPILTTPSLFTDNPTYEDMMLLSALLGPAKVPVATEEDIQSAGGIYDIVATSALAYDASSLTTLVAVANCPRKTDVEPERFHLEPGQRCLVCLCDFEVAEVGRKLIKCGHLFHRECIDQWLTTGRNSCPLCREQGVNEKSRSATEDPTESFDPNRERRDRAPPTEVEG